MKIQYKAIVSKRNGERVPVTGDFNQTSFNFFTLSMIILRNHFPDIRLLDPNDVEILNLYVEE